jgi:TolA-binding protein
MRLSAKTMVRALPGLVLGLTVACGLAAWGQEPSKDGQDRDRGGASSSPSKDLDKALQSFQQYRENASKIAEQSQKDIERMVRELNDLTEMRFKMAVALASQRSEEPGPSEPGFGAPAGSAAQGQASASKDADKEASIRKCENLCRELEQIQNQLRAELTQSRAQAEMLASQIRGLREQQRAQQAQRKEDSDRNSGERSDSSGKK